MAMKRFACEKYSSLEINFASFLATGNIVSQIPLADTFTEAAPCENGMVLNASRAQAALGAPTATSTALGIVYTAEKEYDFTQTGLKNFKRVAGQYPRVGVMSVGDTFTTNCIQFDDGEFTAQTNLEEALAALGTTPLYLGVEANSPVLKITKTAPASGFCADVVKFYTLPNGEKAIKFNVVRV